MSTHVRLFDLSDPAVQARWYPLNDTVMGGRSTGAVGFAEGCLIFSGETNTRGGGFAQVRTPLEPGILEEASGLAVRARPDERSYQLSLTSDARVGSSPVAFRAPLDFSKSPGDGGQWATIAWSELRPTFRGRPQPECVFDPGKAQTLGLFIFDRRDGAFRLVVDEIALIT